MSKISSNTQDDQTNPTLFVLEPVAGKKVSVEFTAPDLSSLGGLTLVREYEKSSSTIIDRIESCIKDPRFEPMVVNSQTEMLLQRIYQIIAGFEDADESDRLCHDGILKMCVGRLASDEIDLASQPTMTRLENRLSRKELFDIGECFVDEFIASYDHEPDSINIAGLLERLIGKLRKHWKHTAIIVRGDSHFCSHDFMDWATDRKDNIHFITELASNVKLQNTSKKWLKSAIATFDTTGEDVRIFHSFLYKAQSWKHQQGVVVKIEVNKLGTNIRFIVTDFKHQRSDLLYSDCYCDRGRMELMIAELKNGLKAGRDRT